MLTAKRPSDEDTARIVAKYLGLKYDWDYRISNELFEFARKRKSFSQRYDEIGYDPRDSQHAMQKMFAAEFGHPVMSKEDSAPISEQSLRYLVVDLLIAYERFCS